MLITLDNNQLSAKLGNQPAFPIFPQSDTLFFLKVVDAQIEFPKDESGDHASQLTLHQNGRDMVAKRLDDAAAQRIADASAAATKRFKDQVAAPGSEAALRKLVEGLRTGQPDYEAMSPAFAAVTRRQLSQLQSLITGLGAMESVSFKGVGPGGADIYQVKLEKGALECRISLGPDGKVEAAGLRPQ